jgi:hypothetical protein
MAEPYNEADQIKPVVCGLASNATRKPDQIASRWSGHSLISIKRQALTHVVCAGTQCTLWRFGGRAGGGMAFRGRTPSRLP